MSTTLSVKKREAIGSNACKKIREKEEVPGVIYGEKQGSVAISFSLEDFLEILKENEQMVKLKLDNQEENTIIKEVQYDAMGDTLLHVDFHRVLMDKKISVEVPLDFQGVSKGAERGGKEDIQLREVTILCYPNKIPESIPVEIEALDIGDQIRVKDLPNLPKDVDIETDEETVVMVIHDKDTPVTPGEEEAAEGEVPTEPEAEFPGAAGESESESEE